MSGTGPSLDDMPTDILKEIVEAVARISVKKRGAGNEICSLSLVNKRLYALAIKLIFRVIDAQKWRQYSMETPYTGMPPAALEHTRYLALGFPLDRVFRSYPGLHPAIRAYTSVAAQFVAILSTAKNVKVLTIHAPKDVIDSFETQVKVLRIKFRSVVELHYHPHPDIMDLNPTLPHLFPNLTTLVSLGLDCYELEPLLEETIAPFLIDVFNRHQLPHLKHLQLHIQFTRELLEWLSHIGSRLETITVDSRDSGSWYNQQYWSHAFDLVDCLNALKDLRNISLPASNLIAYSDEGNYEYVLQKIYDRCPHIEVISQDREAFYELRRRSNGFKGGEFVQKFETTASSMHRNERAKTWMRYLEPSSPHQKLRIVNGVMSVIDINPILETPILVDYPWGDIE